MRNKITPNEIINCGDYCEIVLYNRECKEINRTKVDRDLVEILRENKWSMCKGYVGTMEKRKAVFLHQYVIGKKKGLIIDHINGDKLDNRKTNLRHASRSLNAFNRKTVRGVRKKGNKWYAIICKDYKQISLGGYKTKKEALKVRREFELKLFGENNTI